MDGQQQNEEGASVIAKGKHVVPNGVAVEELDGGKKKLLKECPAKLQELLSAKNLVPVYDAMVDEIVNQPKTRSAFSKWHDMEIVSVLDKFRDQFADKAVKVALCKRESSGGTSRWLEFIDTDIVPTYVPQYDVNNFSDQVIKTIYTTLHFPNGVAVEKLSSWSSRKKLREEIPPKVQEMMEQKGLMDQYESLVNHIVEAHQGNFRKWNLEKIHEILHAYKPMFEPKGVSLFVSHKEEYVHHGQGGHLEIFRWLEFVDRDLQPNYYPQRGADSKKETKCCIQ